MGRRSYRTATCAALTSATVCARRVAVMIFMAIVDVLAQVTPNRCWREIIREDDVGESGTVRMRE